MDTRGYLKRIARVRAGQSERFVVFKLPNGKIGGSIQRSRMVDAFVDALEGKQTRETELMLTAVADSSGSGLSALLQAIKTPLSEGTGEGI